VLSSSPVSYSLLSLASMSVVSRRDRVSHGIEALGINSLFKIQRVDIARKEAALCEVSDSVDCQPLLHPFHPCGHADSHDVMSTTGSPYVP
jgi:hypothetical protein